MEDIMKNFLVLFLTFALMAAMLSGCRMGSDSGQPAVPAGERR